VTGLFGHGNEKSSFVCRICGLAENLLAFRDGSLFGSADGRLRKIILPWDFTALASGQEGN